MFLLLDRSQTLGLGKLCAPYEDRVLKMTRHLDPSHLKDRRRGVGLHQHDGLPSVGLCVSLLRTQTAAAATELMDKTARTSAEAKWISSAWDNLMRDAARK